MKFIDVLSKIAPFLMLIPGYDKYIPLITAAIAIAEASGKNGVDKKKIALESVRAGAVTTNLIAKHTVIDPDKAVIVATNIIDQIVSLVNVNLDLANEVATAKDPFADLK